MSPLIIPAIRQICILFPNGLLKKNQRRNLVQILKDFVVIKLQPALNVAGQFFHLPQRVVEKAVDVVLDEIVTAMARKDRVELRGFGAFSVKDRAGRIGRNPKSGVKVEVPEKSVPVFRPSKEIGRRLNSVVSIPESSERTSRRSR